MIDDDKWGYEWWYMGGYIVLDKEIPLKGRGTQSKDIHVVIDTIRVGFVRQDALTVGWCSCRPHFSCNVNEACLGYACNWSLHGMRHLLFNWLKMWECNHHVLIGWNLSHSSSSFDLQWRLRNMGRQNHHISWIVFCVLHDRLCFKPDWLFLHQFSRSHSCYQFLLCFGPVDGRDDVLESDTWQIQHHFLIHYTLHCLLFPHQFILLWPFLHGYLEHCFCSSLASLLGLYCSRSATECV